MNFFLFLKRCLTCILLIATLACSGGGEVAMHDGMLGMWETKEPRYRDCFMEIKKDRIVFYKTDQGVDLYRIKKLERIPKGNRTLYHIWYRDNADREYLLSLFYLHSVKGDSILFHNQMEFQWTKRTDESAT